LPRFCRNEPLDSLESDHFGMLLALRDCRVSIARPTQRNRFMAKYGAKARSEVKKAIHKTKRGKQKSGKKGKAKSRKQAIAIGLSKARKKGAKVPRKKKAG
jgi:hypothetical protein